MTQGPPRLVLQAESSPTDRENRKGKKERRLTLEGDIALDGWDAWVWGQERELKVEFLGKDHECAPRALGYGEGF